MPTILLMLVQMLMKLTQKPAKEISSVVTVPDFAMRYVSRYLGHDAIRIAILVYRVSQSLDLQFVYDGSAIYRPRYTLPNHHNRCRMCWSLAVAITFTMTRGQTSTPTPSRNRAIAPRRCLVGSSQG